MGSSGQAGRMWHGPQRSELADWVVASQSSFRQGRHFLRAKFRKIKAAACIDGWSQVRGA